jgi:hypothetical protein
MKTLNLCRDTGYGFVGFELGTLDGLRRCQKLSFLGSVCVGLEFDGTQQRTVACMDGICTACLLYVRSELHHAFEGKDWMVSCSVVWYLSVVLNRYSELECASTG